MIIIRRLRANLKAINRAGLTTLADFLRFLVFLISYVIRKVSSAPRLFLNFYLSLITFASSVKFFLTAKLIWGRGRLFRPLTHLGIILLALVTIISGGLLSGTPLVRSPESFASTDYLSYSDVVKSYVSPQLSATIAPRREAIEYTVRPGDTLSSIGQNFRVSTDAIIYANNLSDEDFLRIGQKLTIPPVEGVVYTIKSGDTLSSIAQKFKTPSQAIAEFNYIYEDSSLQVGAKIIVPTAEIPQIPKSFVPPPSAYQPSRISPVPETAYNEEGRPGGVPGATGAFGWPLKSRAITQYFSYYHLGIDIADNVGAPIYAADGGIVIRAGWWLGGFGNAVKIDHGNGYTTMYAHMSRIMVSVGDRVEKGQQIGEVGSTGNSTGPHTHFAVQRFGRYLNPLSVF